MGGRRRLLSLNASPAMPPDVRKVYDLPAPSEISGAVPLSGTGAQPQVLRKLTPGGAEPPPHISRHSR